MREWADKLLIAMMAEDPVIAEEEEVVETDLIEDAAAVQEVAEGHRAEAVVDLLPWILNKGER